MRNCCRCCPCCGRPCRPHPVQPIYTVCTCTRLCDVPMTVYPGPGETVTDGLHDINRTLEKMSGTLTCICRRLHG